MNHYFVTVDGDNENSGMALDDAFRDIVHAVGELDDGGHPVDRRRRVPRAGRHRRQEPHPHPVGARAAGRHRREHPCLQRHARRGLEPRRHARRVRVRRQPSRRHPVRRDPRPWALHPPHHLQQPPRPPGRKPEVRDRCRSAAVPTGRASRSQTAKTPSAARGSTWYPACTRPRTVSSTSGSRTRPGGTDAGVVQ